MGLSELELQKKLQRRSLTARKRQSIFVAQYVHVKYKHIYREAAQMFNQLNALYPHQPNLTKSFEFKNWERRINGLPQVTNHRQRDAANNITYESIPEETVDATNVNNDAIIPLSCPKPANTITYESIPEETIDATNVSNDAIIRSCPKKVMCLEIPLINVSQIRPLETGSQSEVQEETVDEGEANRDNLDNIEPSILDAVPQESIDEMISQLQEDPDLLTIMNSFDIGMEVVVGNSIPQENPEQDEFGLDIDIDVDDRLERHLEDLEVFL